MAKKVTSRDVAVKAGVSQSAVSRAFTPGASVAPGTRERIVAVAQGLGYRPNYIARSLSLKRTNMIGLLMVRVRDAFYADLLDRFTTLLQANNYRTLLLNMGDGGDVEKVVSLALEYQVDGLISTSAILSSNLTSHCASRGVPLLIFNRFSRDMTSANLVRCDHFGGAALLGDLLVRAGHKRIAFIAGEAASSTNLEREAGFRQSLAARKRTLWGREEAGSYEYRDGYFAARSLLGRARRPDAIFAANDMMAMATIDCARSLGLTVPGDLSVVGFDGVEMSARPAYDLTTVVQPVAEMVALAVEILINSITTERTGFETRVLPGALRLGKSARLPD